MLQDELPDHLNIDNGLVEGTYRAWVSYPDWYGNEKARATVEKTIAEIGPMNIEVAGS